MEYFILLCSFIIIDLKLIIAYSSIIYINFIILSLFIMHLNIKFICLIIIFHI